MDLWHVSGWHVLLSFKVTNTTLEHSLKLGGAQTRDNFHTLLVLEACQTCPYTPEDLPDPGMEPASLLSPALAGRFFTTVLPGQPCG